MTQYLKKITLHVFIVLGFILISLIYFNPVLQGKQILQSDIVQYTGMAKQHNDFRTKTGKETYWTNSAFGGMPTYQLGAHYPHNYIKKLDRLIRFLPRPADYLFLYFICFYILLLVLKVDFRLAALGALAFGFSTYLIIILGVGHNSKAHAIAYMPLVLSGIILSFRQKFFLGFFLTTIALALEISANHYQMTYYLLLLTIVLGLVYLYDAYKKNKLHFYFKSLSVLIFAAILSIGLNASNILATQEYVKESTRGPSELTINPDGKQKEVTSGLDRDYITEYSYGVLESLNLFVPRLFGGGSYEDVGEDSSTYTFFRKLGATNMQARNEVRQTPTYWGNQPIVEAPAYVGAVIIFLFVFSLFLVKGRLKWWLVVGIIMSLLLSWGKNLSLVTNFFIDYMPLYNKFRAVSSIQVILELCIPVLGVFGLVRLFNEFETHKSKLRALKYTAFITAGLLILFLIGISSFDFSAERDARYLQAYGNDFLRALKDDRKSFYINDVLRSLVLVVTSVAVIWFYLKKKLSENLVIILFAVLILFDLVVVDRRYVNNDDFVSSIQVKKPFQPNDADKQILQDTSHFRVFDVASNGTKASYFHNALYGYHAAKMGRYNELFDFHISANNVEVINMLNTKYIIAENDDGKIEAFENPEANGNAWFIDHIITVESANEEIMVLDSLNTKKTTIVNSNQFDTKAMNLAYKVDSLAKITLLDYKPNYLKYESSNTTNGFAVFSENYYKQGWQAYINNETVDHIRVNYVLRGLPIPKGNHTIEFKFDPQVVKTGSKISLTSSIIFILFLLGSVFYVIRTKRDKQGA